MGLEGGYVSKTGLWSLQYSCRRLAREARGLDRAKGESSESPVGEIAQGLDSVAQLLDRAMQAIEDEPDPAADPAGDPAGDNIAATGSDGSALVPDLRPPRESTPTPEHELALIAQPFFVSAPDLMAFLCSLRKSGVLLIDTAQERFTIELAMGEILHAHGDAAPGKEQLGNVLVELGTLTEELLQQLLSDRSGTRLASRILELGLAGRGDLMLALETQVRRSFERLFVSEVREFVFWEGPCVWGDQSMRLNATRLLLDGARAADEHRRDAGATATATTTKPGKTGGSDKSVEDVAVRAEGAFASAVFAALSEQDEAVTVAAEPRLGASGGGDGCAADDRSRPPAADSCVDQERRAGDCEASPAQLGEDSSKPGADSTGTLSSSGDRVAGGKNR